jgi:glutaminase
MTNCISKLSGDLKIGFNQIVYLSEKENAYKIYGLGYFIESQNSNEKIQDSLEFFLQILSMNVNSRILSNIASTYANNGVCPITNKNCLSPHTIKRTMQVLYYNFKN